ncbi:unnamed protein product [Schistosoma margrebowiei]|uniref:Uncharacterized protein n=1 Tax=Schistosoma margrebowiei TaxID=48269 RepID=A0A183LTU1_9TREM|nr:unnamed protein product [Schistosoma margrebowiei]
MGAARSHLNSLQIYCTNALSLLNKQLKLGVQIDSIKPDIITVTETWLTQPVDDMERDFESFTLVRAQMVQMVVDGIEEAFA